MWTVPVHPADEAGILVATTIIKQRQNKYFLQGMTPTCSPGPQILFTSTRLTVAIDAPAAVGSSAFPADLLLRIWSLGGCFQQIIHYKEGRWGGV